MTQPKKKYRRKGQNQFPVAPIAVGLLLIGFAVLLAALPKAESNTESLNSVVPMKVNYAAPELSLQNIEGKTERLTDYLGSVVLVNNWATWCPPCISFEMSFPVWLDPNSASLKAFGNGTLPNSYVIDRTGTVRYAWTGEISKAMLEKYVTPLIK